ncbi:hypothetical protein ACWFMH_19525 [Bacillus altitudinis]
MQRSSLAYQKRGRAHRVLPGSMRICETEIRVGTVGCGTAIAARSGVEPYRWK